MKNQEEAKKFFLEKLEGCYYIKHKDYPDNIFWFYDKNFLRQKKLCNILGKKYIIGDINNGELIFEQNLDSKRLWIKYQEIWSLLEKKYLHSFIIK